MHFMPLILCLAQPTTTGAEVLSNDIQAQLLNKIVHYDTVLKQKLSTQQALRILVVHTHNKTEAAERLTRSFAKRGFIATRCRDDQARAHIDAVDIVYLCCPRTLHINRHLPSHAVLSVSSHPTIVQRGGVSIGLGKKQQRPTIYVNMPRLQAEQHTLSPAFLSLSGVVRTYAHET